MDLPTSPGIGCTCIQMQSQAENWKLCPVICTPNFCIPNSVSCCPQKHTPGDASHFRSTPSGSYKPFGVTPWANWKQHMKCFCAFQREQCLQRALKESSAQWREMQSDHPGLADNTLHSSPDVNLYLHPVSRYFTRVKLPPDTPKSPGRGRMVPMGRKLTLVPLLSPSSMSDISGYKTAPLSTLIHLGNPTAITV